MRQGADCAQLKCVSLEGRLLYIFACNILLVQESVAWEMISRKAPQSVFNYSVCVDKKVCAFPEKMIFFLCNYKNVL